MDVTPFWQPFQNVMALQRATADRRYDMAQNNALMDMKRQEFELRQRQNALQMETLEDQRAAQMQAQERAMAAQRRAQELFQGGMTPQAMQAFAIEFPEEAKPYLSAWKDTRPTFKLENGQYLPEDPGYGIGAAPIPNYREPLPKLTGAAANLANILGRTPTQEELFNYERSVAAAGATRVSNTSIVNTKGQDKVDTSYAPDYVKNIVQGGIGDMYSQIDALSTVRDRLFKDNKLSGRRYAAIPENLLPVVAPDVVEARDMVLATVQRGLKAILGAQFTEKEGKMFMQRAYDVRLPTATNARKVDRILRQLEVMAEATADSARYFEEHGTLTGYRGKVYTKDDFLGDRVPVRTPQRGAGPQQGGNQKQGGIKFLGFE